MAANPDFEEKKADHLYLATCPFKKLSNFFSNETIMNVAVDEAIFQAVDEAIFQALFFQGKRTLFFQAMDEAIFQALFFQAVDEAIFEALFLY
ncbi:hypothetical protein GBA52_010725 [Prunus armeniaca]|nr:hypothetical protein GBA52_010725 [Prunus armeniaca]